MYLPLLLKVLKTGVTTHHDLKNACSLKLRILLHPRTCWAFVSQNAGDLNSTSCKHWPFCSTLMMRVVGPHLPITIDSSWAFLSLHGSPFPYLSVSGKSISLCSSSACLLLWKPSHFPNTMKLSSPVSFTLCQIVKGAKIIRNTTHSFRCVAILRQFEMRIMRTITKFILRVSVSILCNKRFSSSCNRDIQCCKTATSVRLYDFL